MAMLRQGVAPEVASWGLTLMNILEVLAFFMYIFILPMFAIPEWCSGKEESGLIVTCQSTDELSNHPVSGTNYFANGLNCSIDLVSIIIISMVQIRKVRRHRTENKDKVRVIALFVMLGMSFLDSAIQLASGSSNLYGIFYLTDLLRPWVVICSFAHLRSSLSLIFLNVRDSFVTLLILFIFLGYFAFFGQVIFFASLQGATLMNDFGDSYWEFDVLFTTENFPDFVLPAYDTHYYSIIFFMLFIFIAVYFMGGILLSIVFDNYKNRIEEMSKEKLENRIHYIKIFYDMYDDENLGYLTYKQARDFFEQVLNLNYLKRKHRKTIVRIIKIVDPEHYKIVLKERILDFFSISGFKIIAQLDNEQRRLH